MDRGGATGKTANMKRKVVLLMLVVFFGVIAGLSLLGQWSMGEEGVSGDTLLIEVAEKYGIPLEEIYEYWKIPRDLSPRASVSEARVIAGFSTGNFKTWVGTRSNHEELIEEEVHTDAATAEIKGSDTLKMISEKYNVPLESIYSKWKISNLVSADTPLKEVRDGYGISMEDFKAWVAAESQKKRP